MVARSWGWAIISAITAKTVAIKRVMSAGRRKYIITPVSNGTMSNQGDMLKVDCNALLYNSLLSTEPDVWLRLAMRKMMSVIPIVGNVV